MSCREPPAANPPPRTRKSNSQSNWADWARAVGPLVFTQVAAVPLTEAARGGRLELPLLGTTLAFWRASFGKPLLTVELELKMAPDAADSMRCRRVATKSGASDPSVDGTA